MRENGAGGGKKRDCYRGATVEVSGCETKRGHDWFVTKGLSTNTDISSASI